MSFLKKRSMAVQLLVSFVLCYLLTFITFSIMAYLLGREVGDYSSMKEYIIISVYVSNALILTTISGIRGANYLIFCLLGSVIYSFMTLLISFILKNSDFSILWGIHLSVSALSGGLSAAFVHICHIPAIKRRRKARI